MLKMLTLAGALLAATAHAEIVQPSAQGSFPIIVDEDEPRAGPVVIDGCELKPGAVCPGVDLRHVDLRGLKLNGIDLSGAKLTRTNFFGAELKGANLSGADLRGAHLEMAQSFGGPT